MAGYIGSRAVSVNTTSATITDDLTIGDDLTVTDDMTVGGTLGVTGVVTANAGVVVDNFTLDGTSLSLSSGVMTLNAADVRIKNLANNETMAQFDDDGAVNLYNNNELSLSTVAGGSVSIYNDLSLTSDGGIINIGAGNDLKITHDGTNGDFESAGNLTFDVVGELIIDADLQGEGNGILLKDDGTTYGNIFRSESDLIIMSVASDEDLLFKGNDGGSTITALTLDMSDAGTATFNSNVIVGGNVGIGGTSVDTKLHIDGCPDNKVITFEQSGRKSAIGTAFSATSLNSRLDFFVSDGNQNGGNHTRMSVLSNGGITFNGDTAAANVLEDYEEGAWTPALQDGTSVTVNDAYYIKIGSVVHIGMSIVGASNSSSTAILFTGLPYAVRNGNDQAFGLTIANTTVGTDNIYFSFLRNTQNIGCATNANVDIATSVLSTKKLCMSGHYFVA